jgi:hypothetical protein
MSILGGIIFVTLVVPRSTLQLGTAALAGLVALYVPAERVHTDAIDQCASKRNGVARCAKPDHLR